MRERNTGKSHVKSDQYILVGGPTCLLVICAVSRQRGISSLGHAGQSAAQRRTGIWGRCSVQSREFEGQPGFTPEALTCGPRVVRSLLAVLWKGPGRVTGLGRCGGVWVEDWYDVWAPVKVPVEEHTSYFTGTCAAAELQLCDDYDYMNTITIMNIVWI